MPGSHLNTPESWTSGKPTVAGQKQPTHLQLIIILDVSVDVMGHSLAGGVPEPLHVGTKGLVVGVNLHRAQHGIDLLLEPAAAAAAAAAASVCYLLLVKYVANICFCNVASIVICILYLLFCNTYFCSTYSAYICALNNTFCNVYRGGGAVCQLDSTMMDFGLVVAGYVIC